MSLENRSLEDKMAWTLGCIVFSIFFVLLGYHLIRVFFVKPDCEFVLGRVNGTLESGFFFSSLAASLFSFGKIIYNLVKKEYSQLGIWFFILAFILLITYLVFLQVIGECWLT